VAEQSRSLGTGRVHDRADIVHTAFEAGQLGVGDGSDSPVPRLSKTISRANDASRSRKAAKRGSSHIISTLETHPGT
jgi:hypothetical protein